MVSDKLKEQNVPSEPRAKYMCTELKEKQATTTHSYNLRSKARLQQQTDLNNNQKEFEDRNQIVHNGGAVKRGYDNVDTVDNETEDDSVHPMSVMNDRKSPAKKAKIIVTLKEMNDFFNLLKEQSIREFLRRDACCLISDKYALAMVFTYFKRANFTCDEFTVFNFYLALYLASDIEEDVDEYKYEIFPWALGTKWRTKFSGFLKKRDALLRRIGYRAIVSRKCCEEVMGFVSDHYAWKRERSEDHGGATRAYLITRGRRLLSSRSYPEDDELNLPRGPYELPRPCALCFLSRSDTNINHAKHIAPLTPNINFRPKLSTAIFPFPTYSNLISDADEYDSSSNTSGYVSNESHASSNLSTYSAESSFHSTAIDWTLRKKDDLKSETNTQHINNKTLKQVKTPTTKLKSNSNTYCLKKDLNKQKHDENYFLKPESNIIFKSKLESMPKKCKQANSALKYASVACVDKYHINELDNTDNNDDDVFEEERTMVSAKIRNKSDNVSDWSTLKHPRRICHFEIYSSDEDEKSETKFKISPIESNDRLVPKEIISIVIK